MNVIEQLLKNMETGAYPPFSVISYEVGNIVEETEAIIARLDRPIVCECCRDDTRKWSSVAFARIMRPSDDDNPTPIDIGWFRLCRDCYGLAVAQDDPKNCELMKNGEAFDPFFLILFRIYPEGDIRLYREGYLAWPMVK